MRGEFQFESTRPDKAALEYTRHLGQLLREARPREIKVDEHRVFVRGGILRFVSTWNLLVCVTSATVDVIPGPARVTVRYEIKVTELLVCCAFANLFFLVEGASSGSWFAVIAGPAMVWLWLFGMNYLVMLYRMTSAFERIAKAVCEAEVRVPVTG